MYIFNWKNILRLLDHIRLEVEIKWVYNSHVLLGKYHFMNCTPFLHRYILMLNNMGFFKEKKFIDLWICNLNDKIPKYGIFIWNM